MEHLEIKTFYTRSQRFYAKLIWYIFPSFFFFFFSNKLVLSARMVVMLLFGCVLSLYAQLASEKARVTRLSKSIDSSCWCRANPVQRVGPVNQGRTRFFCRWTRGHADTRTRLPLTRARMQARKKRIRIGKRPPLRR